MAAVVVGCGSDRGDESRTGDPAEKPADELLSAGTELGDGLVVPEGSRLAGEVFRRPGYRIAEPTPAHAVPAAPPPTATGSGGTVATDPPAETAPQTTTPPLEVDTALEGWTALLVVDGDPFTVWDDLAAQVRQVGPGLSGSADACLWQIEQDSADPTAGQPIPVGRGHPSEGIDHLRCEASASDGTRQVSVALRYGGEHRGTLTIEATPSDGAPSSYAEGSLIGPDGPSGTGDPGEPVVPDASGGDTQAPTSSTTSQPPDTLPVPGPEEVDAEARALLPDPDPGPAPAPGDRFGGIGNCLATGYDQMVVPEGASLVATVGGGDGSSVLRVDDPRRAIDALLASSSEGPDTESFDPGVVEELPLADGGTVWAVGFSISAGGGACDLLASPDGGYLLVTMHSD